MRSRVILETENEELKREIAKWREEAHGEVYENNMLRQKIARLREALEEIKNYGTPGYEEGGISMPDRRSPGNVRNGGGVGMSKDRTQEELIKCLENIKTELEEFMAMCKGLYCRNCYMENIEGGICNIFNDKFIDQFIDQLIRSIEGLKKESMEV